MTPPLPPSLSLLCSYFTPIDAYFFNCKSVIISIGNTITLSRRKSSTPTNGRKSLVRFEFQLLELCIFYFCYLLLNLMDVWNLLLLTLLGFWIGFIWMKLEEMNWNGTILFCSTLFLRFLFLKLKKKKIQFSLLLNFSSDLINERRVVSNSELSRDERHTQISH